MKGTRLSHLAAMLLVGDGIFAMIHPHREPDAWWVGPQVWKDFLGEIAKRPALARTLAAVQVAAAMYWLLNSETSGEAAKHRRRLKA